MENFAVGPSMRWCLFTETLLHWCCPTLVPSKGVQQLIDPVLQLSFQVWTKQMQDMLNSRKRGDMAFRDKDFKTAIDCYTQVSPPSSTKRSKRGY